jgi:hypothetical protein
MIRLLLISLCVVAMLAQDLTTRIVDTLYAQDGTLFSGTVQVVAMRLENGDRTVIPKPMTIKVSAGRLDIRLAANAGSRPEGTSYRATYLPDGGKQSWTEYWVVPASGTPVTVKQVWVPFMPSPNALIDIGQIGGLLDSLAGKSPVAHGHDSVYVRLDGSYVNPNWLAGLDWSRLLNTPASFPAAPHTHPLSGDLGGTTDAGTVLRVQGREYAAALPIDGQVYAWDSLASKMMPKSFNGAYADGEVPGGAMDGLNRDFTLLAIPAPAGSLQLYRNGILQKRGIGGDYEIAGNAITFYPASTPQSGDILQASYRWAPALPFGSQVISVFGRAGNVELQEGDVSTSQVAEGSRLYFTEERVRAALFATGPIQFNPSTGALSCPTCITTPYTLPAATSTALGGIKVGANLSVTPDGTLSAPAASTSYAFQPPLSEAAGNVSIDLSGYATVSHGHTIGSLSGQLVDAQVPATAVTQHQSALTVGWSQVINPPVTYAPEPHAHGVADLPTTGGDLSGTLGAATVNRIRGYEVDSTAPTDGQVYRWNASASRFELAKLKHVVDFVNATSLTVTAAEHGLAGTVFRVTCYDNSNPRRMVEGNDILIDDTTRTITATFVVPWSGRCVFQ